jgi:hypothetical protein
MASSSLDIPIVRAGGERRVYTWAAVIALLFMFAGFAPTFYLKGVYGAPELSELKLMHGIVMTAWFTLFLVQARLVATGRISMHRQLGMAGLVVALLVVTMGVTTALASARAGFAPLGLSPLVFLVMPLGEMVVFAGIFTAAIAMRKRAAHHKRLMLVATLAMLTPAMARLPFEFVKTGGPPVFFAMTDFVILACIAFDTAKNRRLHPAFVGALVFVVVVQVGRLLVSQTPQWMTFAKWLVG